jgi:pyruvate,water dikinase
MDQPFILWFKDIGIKDVPVVGGKNASLGEMYQNLTKKGISIPNGFAITAHAYRYLLEKSGIKDEIRKCLKGLDTGNMDNLSERGHRVRELIRGADLPAELRKEIVDAYRKLCKEYGKHADVAVRSSATAEDLPDASFAGQQETYLNVKGEAALIESCKKCFASLFTNRAISYRHDKKFDHFSVALSIGVEKMVRSDLACSGVIFTIDTETGFQNVVFITGSYGLGENVVQGKVNPDEYYVFKPTLRQGFKPIISKKVGSKEIKMIYDEQGSKHTKNVSVPVHERNEFVLNEREILKLAEWAIAIEEHYSKKRNAWTPMDIEWAKDGRTGRLFVVQARPETVQSQKDRSRLEIYLLRQRGKVLCKGHSVGDRIAAGKAHFISNVRDIKKFRQGEILVTEMTDPDWEPIMKIAAAIVTNRGGRTCHAAIISREMGIPCIVGTIDGSSKIKTGQKVTVSCAEGEIGNVYAGILKFEVKSVDLKKIPVTHTKIMMNLGNPDEAFALSFIPCGGGGLVREEFIINSYIKIHPKALIDFKKLKDEHVKQQIEEITYGYKDKTQFFVDKLAQGIGMIAAAFYPLDVIVRMSDLKTNEYANLIGGHAYEPKEDNPMIGWRGASRYYSEYREAFALECKAMKKVRDEMGLRNVKIMIPFCRTPEEGRKVIAEMARHGLKQGHNQLEVYVMCEIPSNVILADEFCKIFDGFSIGSNDLTQLTLGIDRDSELVANLYDERNDAVLRLIQQVIKTAKRYERKVGICGDAPSTFPDFARFLVEQRIDSISLSPDAVLRTTMIIAEEEKKLHY